MARATRFQGHEALPNPRRPVWEELLSGSLDAEQVEIEGVIIAATASRVELLTRDGTAVLESNDLYPLPAELRLAERRPRFIGAKVRFRGVFATSWRRELGRLHPGVFFLGNATLSLDEPAPGGFEDVEPVTIPDLWRFTSKSTALKRVRLKGRMMARRGDLYLLSDGTNSLRLESRRHLDAEPGDWVEAVGFARTGAVSPLLVHPVVRVEPGEALHGPEKIAPEALPDFKLDGRMIAVDARVLSDTFRQEERALELEAGQRRFLAVGPANPDAKPLERDTLVRVGGVYFGGTSGHAGSGTDTFELRLASSDGIEVLARPPWWTPRRLALLVSALLGGLALVIAWATILHRLVARKTSELAVEIQEKEHAETERTLEMERARVARDLHDELGAGLTEIGMLSSLVGNPAVPDDAKASYIGTMRDVSRSLVSGLDEIVWAINPGYDSVDDAASYLWLQAQRMLKPAGIECRLSDREEIPYRHFGSRRRHSLLLAFKEALNNVVRHSQASVVTLGIGIANGAVEVTIADDGIGFDAGGGTAPGSQGLTGMRQRMREFDGDCEIVSEKNRGTIVKLVLPLRTA